uniref:major facilitator superfamily domain-containing protein 1 isoform X7 n=1 Tax=Agelaius phoeniceus TaxID=39638 RepID=UPI0023EB6C6A|nr:major facilitator superfamily domain-containing protein 1 isoform X7 [Agelaius phoeniceus]
MAEEQRALLGAEGGDGSHGSPGPPRALPAACDPRRLPHRLLVLALMCFLGFGAGRARGLRVAGGVGVWGPGHSPEASPSPRRQLLLLRQPGRSADAGSAETAVSAWLLLNAHSGMFFPLPLCCAGHEGEHSPVHGPLCLVLVAQRGAVLLWRLPDRQSVWDPVGHCNIQHLCVCWAGGFCSGSTVQYLLADGSGQVHIWGSTVNMNIMGWIYSRVQDLLGSAGPSTLGLALLIGGVTCLFSLSCALILAYLDRRAEKLLCKEQGKTGEVIKLTDVKDFSLSLWLIFVICVCYYAAVFPFIGLGKVFFIEKFRFSPQEASAINSIVYIISAPMSPVFGLLVDKVGKNIIWVLCAVVTTLASHIMLAFTFWNPWIAMCLLGLAYSLLACALWPMVAFVVPEHQLGTAYGFMQSIQNLGLAVIAIAAGMILDTRGYLFLEVFFSACVCLSLLAVVMLYFVNHLTAPSSLLLLFLNPGPQKCAEIAAWPCGNAGML